MRWRKVSLIGVGLLGGSLGLALGKNGLASQVFGFVRRQSSIDECVQKGAVDLATMDAEEAVRGADLVIFCTPLAQMAELAKVIAPHLDKDAIVTDVGSVKGVLVEEVLPIFQEQNIAFIGSHPMAGSEKTGVAAARPDLFQDASCVVTPTEEVLEVVTNQVEDLWRSVGGRVMRLSPKVHDELVSRSSHLPHILASLLASYVLDPKYPAEQSGLCANGFKDSTRIAASSPEMWRDIIISNREQISKALGDYVADMKDFAAIMERNDPAEIEEFFRKAKIRRNGWTAQYASLSFE